MCYANYFYTGISLYNMYTLSNNTYYIILQFCIYTVDTWKLNSRILFALIYVLCKIAIIINRNNLNYLEVTQTFLYNKII